MLRSLPVITGLPLSRGSRACSQAAKKASASMWMIARGNVEMVRLPCLPLANQRFLS